MARPGKSSAKQSEGRAGEKYLPVGGRVKKLRAVEDQSAPIPIERTSELGGRIVNMCSLNASSEGSLGHSLEEGYREWKVVAQAHGPSRSSRMPRSFRVREPMVAGTALFFLHTAVEEQRKRLRKGSGLCVPIRCASSCSSIKRSASRSSLHRARSTIGSGPCPTRSPRS